MKKLIGKKVKVISDNDCYDSFRDKTLIITHASNSGRGYDDSCYPEMLCDFEDEQGNQIPCALYEYEFELI
jgi:hypothetical protein